MRSILCHLSYFFLGVSKISFLLTLSNNQTIEFADHYLEKHVHVHTHHALILRRSTNGQQNS